MAKRKSRLAFVLPLGLQVSKQPVHPETDENEQRREIRQQNKPA